MPQVRPGVLTTEALALDPADRLRRVTDLLDSLDGTLDERWADSWAAELGRRASAADSREGAGGSRGADWNDVRARILRDPDME